MVQLNLQRDGLDICVAVALEALQRPGAVLLVPTETVYGLIARADDAAACERIFELKQRPEHKVLGFFTPDRATLVRHGAQFNAEADALWRKYTPGPLTMILPTADGTIGVRCPDHPLLQKILQGYGELVVQTSANRSGSPNPRQISEALAQLDGSPDVAIDGGAIPADACGSTIVDLCGPTRKILRQGALKLD